MVWAVVDGGLVVVVTGVKVAVGFGFTAWLNPNTRLMATAAITGAVTIMLLVSVESAIFQPSKSSLKGRLFWDNLHRSIKAAGLITVHILIYQDPLNSGQAFQER